MIVRLTIGNALDRVDIRADGNTVRFALPLSGEQLSRFIALMQSVLGAP
jgi:hypothetical protein